MSAAHPAGALGLWLSMATILAALPAAARADDADDAKAIVRLAGRDHGFAVVIGCGSEKSPGLLAELAANSRMLVQGLAGDDAAVARARKAIEAKGLIGRASVDRLPPHGAVPYVPHLVSVLVIEDLNALAKSVANVEDLAAAADRWTRLAVSPTGAICGRQADGQWVAARAPAPEGMDEWTHPQHGADGNMVSGDKRVRFPLGLRWIDGLPKNFGRWASVRGWVIAGGRTYTLSSTELENLPGRKTEHYLVCRDAFNGLPLWKLNLQTSDDGAYLNWQNAGPLVAVGDRAFAVLKDKPVAVDADTGQVAHTFDTRFAPVRVAVADGVLVAACWEGREMSKAPWIQGSLWGTWAPKGDSGTVEAFDTASGSPKWPAPLAVAAQQVLVADGVAYVLAVKGNPPAEQQVIAVELATGKERWRAAHDKFGPDADLQLSVAGKGFVVIARRRTGIAIGLAAADGKPLWGHDEPGKPPAKGGAAWVWTPLVDGLLWYRGSARDPLTGEPVARLTTGIGGQGCTPSAIVNNIITHSRGCSYTEFSPPATQPGGQAKPPRGIAFRAARGGCMEGMVPAYGMFYTGQNSCRCAPGQVLGFLAFGYNGESPTKEDFERPRPVEKGPAFANPPAMQADPAAWPTYRGNPARSGVATGEVPRPLTIAWRSKPLTTSDGGPLAVAWKSRLTPPLTAPVASGGRAFVAACDTGQVFCFNAADGRPQWVVALGGRIDSPPTICDWLCVVGCHDGWVYALRVTDGELAWRTRIAPLDRRMIDHGQVASVWPAVGSVLAVGDTLYTHAGRSNEADGGIAVVAIDPKTGQTVWAKAIAPGPAHRNEFLSLADGAIAWNDTRLDPRTGATVAPGKAGYVDPLLDGYLGGQVLGRRGLRAATDMLSIEVGDACVARPGLKAMPPPPPPPPPSTQPARPPAPPKPLWLGGNPRASLNCLAMVGEYVVLAGRPVGKPDCPGGLWVLDAKDGKLVRGCDLTLPAAPIHDGLAVAGGRVFVALQDGTLVAVETKGE